MAMTEREFLNKVLATEGISDEMKGYATEGIAKLDARNDKRKNTQTKAQKENAETMKSIVATLTEKGKMVASEIATALGISTQKASALCKLLVNDGTLTVGEVKVKNKGAVKQYSLATPTAEEPSAEDEETEAES
jgi:predicted HTH transcriptional regulator